MDLLAQIGQFFAEAFAWVASAVSSLWSVALETALVKGLSAALGSGVAKLLVAATLLLIIGTVLHKLGVLPDGFFKIFVAVFMLAVAISLVSALIAGEYWIAFGLFILAVLVLAACATVDPAVTQMALEVLSDVNAIIGDVAGAIADGVGTLAGSLLPIVLGFGALYLLSNSSSQQPERIEYGSANPEA